MARFHSNNCRVANTIIFRKNREICGHQSRVCLKAARSLGSLPKARTCRHSGRIWLYVWWIKRNLNHVLVFGMAG
nr:MAG TPA: hypothetical protein [Caudoviricetes sp.]